MAEEIFVGQAFDVETEDGTKLKINVAPPSTTNKVQRNLSGQMGTGQDASGFYEQKEKKVKMYQGATVSWIPVGQFQRHLSRGFTVQPTRAPRPTPFPCDTIRNDGTVCEKPFVSRLDRLRHIKNAHADAAMFVLTDDEQALLAGDLTAARRIVPEKERGGHKEVDLDALVEERARELAQEMVLEGAVVGGIKAPVMNSAPFIEPEVPVTNIKVEHTCNAKGRFGRFDPTCEACRLKKIAAGEDNVES